eukprot:TRINITY_DN851_c0_g2_i7.p1 TRINITY_DN851_c0_g2~~TRINITY_DN851_c0_g2_i7.p1  ORF type:complete len:429 (+),score=137.89 TRINITY_DN851_c0_g2_i7:50-1336(+)
MQKYKLLGKKGEGTFSAVLKAQCTSTGKIVAVKCMKNRFDSVEQVNRLREIQALRRLSPHHNIVKLIEVLYDRSTGRLALVFELMEMDLYDLIKGRRQFLPEDRVLHTMYQLTRAIEHMHRNGIFHRDVKPENVLISGDKVKLADFGSCRGIYSKQPFTEYIATRWYRAPECLLSDGYYNFRMDMWGIGCVFFEIQALYPLFPGTNETDQLCKIHKMLGTPSTATLKKLRQNSSQGDADFPAEKGVPMAQLLPSHVSAEATDLLTSMLAYDPDDRITAKKAIRHTYFRDIRELDRQLRAKPHPTASDSSPTASQQPAFPQRPSPPQQPDATPASTRRASHHHHHRPSTIPTVSQGALSTSTLPSLNAATKAANEAAPLIAPMKKNPSKASLLPSIDTAMKKEPLPMLPAVPSRKLGNVGNASSPLQLE